MAAQDLATTAGGFGSLGVLFSLIDLTTDWMSEWNSTLEVTPFPAAPF